MHEHDKVGERIQSPGWRQSDEIRVRHNPWETMT